MQIRWKSYLSSSFFVNNNVGKGGVLSLFVFVVYAGDLPLKLNNLKVGCFLKTSCLDHIRLLMICVCFSSSPPDL